MRSGKIGSWNIGVNAIISDNGNVNFETDGDFKIVTNGNHGIKGTGTKIDIKGITVSINDGAIGVDKSKAHFGLEAGSGLTISQGNMSTTGLSNGINLNASGGSCSFGGGDNLSLNSTGTTEVKGNKVKITGELELPSTIKVGNKTFEEYIQKAIETALNSPSAGIQGSLNAIINKLLSGKQLSISTTSSKTGSSEGHSHSYTKVTGVHF